MCLTMVKSRIKVMNEFLFELMRNIRKRPGLNIQKTLKNEDFLTTSQKGKRNNITNFKPHFMLTREIVPKEIDLIIIFKIVFHYSHSIDLYLSMQTIPLGLDGPRATSYTWHVDFSPIRIWFYVMTFNPHSLTFIHPFHAIVALFYSISVFY